MYRNLGAELKRKGLTQEDLAKRMGLARSTMSAKFNGKSSITLREANEIKRILGVSDPLEFLFQEEPA